MAHMRQSRPDAGLGFRVEVLEMFEGVPPSLGRGPGELLLRHYSSIELSDTKVYEP